MKKKKRKIKTRNKSYSLSDCVFYKLKEKRKLCEILFTSLDEINKILNDAHSYKVFDQVNKETNKKRRIEQPTNKLDILHTRIASLLCRVSLPEYVFSGRKKHSNVSNAREHLGFYPVLTSDIKSFFPSTSKEMVFSFFFLTMCCSPDVAELLSKICTFEGHIPTGSRISMPLAFWANMRMFESLNALSKINNVTMTVYVDDITFSGLSVNSAFKYKCHKIICRYGHIMHPKKTVLYKREMPKLITGVIVHGNELKVRNSQHEKMFLEFEKWQSIDDPLELEALHRRLLGRINSFSAIDSRYKDKARVFRQTN